MIAPEAWSPPRASDLSQRSPALTFSRNDGRLAFLIALAVPARQVQTARGAGVNIAGGELRFVAQRFERQADPVEPSSEFCRKQQEGAVAYGGPPDCDYVLPRGVRLQFADATLGDRCDFQKTMRL